MFPPRGPRRNGEGQGGDDTDKREGPPTPVSHCQTFGGLFAGSQGEVLGDPAVVSLASPFLSHTSVGIEGRSSCHIPGCGPRCA